jgi:hypothetical protein
MKAQKRTAVKGRNLAVFTKPTVVQGRDKIIKIAATITITPPNLLGIALSRQ